MVFDKKNRLLLNKYIKPCKSRIAVITLLAIFAALFEAVNLGALVPLLQLVNGTETPGGNFWSLLTRAFSFIGLELNFTNLLLIMATLFSVGQVLFFLKKRMQAKMWFALSSDIKKSLFSEALRTDIGYHYSHKAGDLIDLIARQSENGAGVAFTITEIFTFVFFILIYVIMLLYISIQMTIVCLAIALSSFYLLNYYISKSRQMGINNVNVNMQMNSFINERFNLVKLIKIFSTEQKEEDRFKKIRESYAQSNSNFLINGIKIEAIFQFIIFSIAIIILYVSTIQFNMPLPLLLVFIFVLMRLTDPLRQLNGQRHVIAAQIAGLEKADEVLELIKTHKTIVNGEKQFSSFSDSISIRDVTFSYDPKTPVLSGITFDVGKNEMVALVGVSGGGKSTLVDLLIRLIEPDKGEILIDGDNIQKFNIESYHKRIGFVSQDSYLFNDTILNNICYGSDYISKDEAIEVAKRAYAHDFIMELPERYATEIGEKGVKLSGGQKQRLSLARALYKKPEILILDEATSSLDSESEKIIQESIASIKNKYTIIAIAHRISTIKNADKILVIEKGSVVETGTHEKLIEKGGIYSNYYNIQYDNWRSTTKNNNAGKFEV
jgi:subfamily B ATP-binding cassette protein MsbA